MGGSTARAFGTLYRQFQAEANAGYAARGWPDVTLSHVQFLMELDERGTRLSDIAAALGTTKQYVGKLSKEMEAKRLVSLAADPVDGRAILAKPTERGRSLFQDACEIRANLEGQFVSALSPRAAATFRKMLLDMLEHRELRQADPEQRSSRRV